VTGRCSQGHPVSNGAAFCETCGEALTADGQAATERTSAHGGSRNRRIGLIALAVALVLAGATAFAAVRARRSHTEHTIRGIVTLTSSDLEGDLATCHGVDGYDDFDSGTTVTVRDRSNSIVGSTTLEHFKANSDYVRAVVQSGGTQAGAEDDLYDVGGTDGVRCPLAFTVTVDDSAFYSIEIGHRGAQTETRRNLKKHGWRVTYTLG
jgi:hypothetical protein